MAVIPALCLPCEPSLSAEVAVTAVWGEGCHYVPCAAIENILAHVEIK